MATRLRIGDWLVDARSEEISRNGETARLEARTLRLLLHLADHAGELVSIEDLLEHVWAGVTVSSDSVYQAVASLRRVLGDDPKQPTYIETVPRLGYRMVASVGDSPAASPAPTIERNESRVAPLTSRWSAVTRSRIALGAIAVMGIAGILWFNGAIGSKTPSPATAVSRVSRRSIAVLPFLDLTQAMDEEPFADGMTEELIARLSKLPGFRVPAPSASFYFKGKQLPVAVMAESLGVAWVLDGSVRKSGARVRVAARLVRADDGYVAWTETYDRAFDDILMVQDDIAGAVTKALLASITEGPDPN